MDERLVTEALFRMEILKIAPAVIEQFPDSGNIGRSDSMTGEFSYIGADDGEKVLQFQKEKKALVYFIVRSHGEMGCVDSYLFVSSYENDWRAERQQLLLGDAIAYSIPLDYPEFAEMGFIGVKSDGDGGLIRTY